MVMLKFYVQTFFVSFIAKGYIFVHIIWTFSYLAWYIY